MMIQGNKKVGAVSEENEQTLQQKLALTQDQMAQLCWLNFTFSDVVQQEKSDGEFQSQQDLEKVLTDQFMLANFQPE